MTPTASAKAVPSAKSSKSFTPFSAQLTKSLQDVSRTIDENKATLDSVQELGINLAQTVGALSASALKYANLVNTILDGILPVIEKLPILPPKTQQFLKDLDAFADKFLATAQSAQKISVSVETGLMAGDISALKTHSADLQKVVSSVKAILPDK
jgi:hypothetical protein